MSSTVAFDKNSKVVSFELDNFMTIRQAVLTFDETNILNITGYNDSGKSAIIRALRILFYNDMPNDQVDMITDGQDHFRVAANFSDGVTVVKYKYADGKSVWEMLQNHAMIYTNRLPNGIQAIAGVPEVIAKYLNVVQDEITEEKLNVRTNEDKLFLVNTSGGDNYKIINSVLHCDVLSESVRLLNADRTKLQTEITHKNATILAYQNQLETIQVVDDYYMNEVSRLAKEVHGLKQPLMHLETIQEQLQVMDECQVPPELPILDRSRFDMLEQLMELQEQVNLPVFPECSTVDTTRLQLLEQIQEVESELHGSVAPEVTLVQLERYNELLAVVQQYNQVYELEVMEQQVEHNAAEVQKQLAQLSEQYNFKICDGCGAIVR